MVHWSGTAQKVTGMEAKTTQFVIDYRLIIGKTIQWLNLSQQVAQFNSKVLFPYI